MKKTYVNQWSLSCIVVMSLLAFFFVSVAVGSDGEDPLAFQDLQLVWSANYGQGEQIFFSTWQGDTWKQPLQLSDGKNFVFKPVSSMGSDGKIWVVWTEREQQKSLLQFTVYRSSWSSVQQIDTGMENNRSVSLVVDTHNTPWIAWTATGDSYTDVYWSRWNGKGWGAPEKAHPDNAVPDINPTLDLDEQGQVVLSFLTFRNGKYISLGYKWDDGQWQPCTPEFLKKKRRQKEEIAKELPIMPGFITEPQKATLLIQTLDSAVSIPLSQL